MLGWSLVTFRGKHGAGGRGQRGKATGLEAPQRLPGASHVAGTTRVVRGVLKPADNAPPCSTANPSLSSWTGLYRLFNSLLASQQESFPAVLLPEISHKQKGDPLPHTQQPEIDQTKHLEEESQTQDSNNFL